MKRVSERASVCERVSQSAKQGNARGESSVVKRACLVARSEKVRQIWKGRDKIRDRRREQARSTKLSQKRRCFAMKGGEGTKSSEAR